MWNAIIKWMFCVCWNLYYFTCVWVCTLVCIQLCSYLWISRTVLKVVLQFPSVFNFFFFWDGFSLFWKWPDKLGWLVWKLQGSDYLCLSSGLQIGPSTLDLLKVCSGDWTCHHVCKASSLLTRYFSRCILKVKDKYFLEV